MAGSGFMILCFQSTPAGANKMREANLGTPAAKHFKKPPQSISKKTAAKHFKKNTRKKGAAKTLSAPQYLHFAAQQTCITSN